MFIIRLELFYSEITLFSSVDTILFQKKIITSLRVIDFSMQQNKTRVQFLRKKRERFQVAKFWVANRHYRYQKKFH